MRATRHLSLVTAIGRRLDRTVCDGAVANAARSVSQDLERANQRRDAWLAVHQVEQQLASRTTVAASPTTVPAPRPTVPAPRRTS